jgi:hypothetical protein
MQPLSIGLMIIPRYFPSVGPPPLFPRWSNTGLSDAILGGGEAWQTPPTHSPSAEDDGRWTLDFRR